MAARITVITDGSAPAIALARWLAQRGVRATVLEARSSTDVARIAHARQRNRPAERLISLADHAEGSDVDGGAALRVGRDWLSHLPLIEQRGAMQLLEENRRADAPGHEHLDTLLRSVVAGTLRTTKSSRGRPKGANPFAGVGFDVIVAMLCEPAGSWTERDLADLVGRSPSAINRVLRELRLRGYLQRSRGATRVSRAEVLRDDLLAAWRGTVAERQGQVLSCPSGVLPKDLIHRLQSRGEQLLLAGVSACDAADGLVESIVTVYADSQATTALTELGCTPSIAGMGDITVWAVPERAVFYAPRKIGQLAATNRVITYLDVAIGSSERYLNAAKTVWDEL